MATSKASSAAVTVPLLSLRGVPGGSSETLMVPEQAGMLMAMTVRRNETHARSSATFVLVPSAL